MKKKIQIIAVIMLISGSLIILGTFLLPKILLDYHTYQISQMQPMGLLMIDQNGNGVDSEISIHIPLYESSDSITRQDIVDVEQAAAIFMITDTLIIADHNYQEFNLLPKVTVGTTAQIYSFKTDETAEYMCIETGDGFNEDKMLYNSSHESLIQKNKGKLVMYTCMENTRHIWYTVWAQIV